MVSGIEKILEDYRYKNRIEYLRNKRSRYLKNRKTINSKIMSDSKLRRIKVYNLNVNVSYGFFENKLLTYYDIIQFDSYKIKSKSELSHILDKYSNKSYDLIFKEYTPRKIEYLIVDGIDSRIQPSFLKISLDKNKK